MAYKIGGHTGYASPGKDTATKLDWLALSLPYTGLILIKNGVGQ